MVRKMFCAMFVMTVAVGFVLGSESNGVITKATSSSFTFQKTTKGKADGDPIQLTLKEKGKVLKGTFNKETKKYEAGDAIEGGLKNKIFTGKKGVIARVTFDGASASQILVLAPKKKKDDK